MKNSILASRYAKAIFEIALQNDSVDIINQDLGSFVEVLEDNSKLAMIFSHPRLSRDEKYQIVDDFYNVAFENEYVKNFLHLLIKKKREKELSNIFYSWQDFFNRYKEVLPVEVVSASELSSQQVESLRSKILVKTKREPMFNIEIKPQLLGGMIIKYEDKIIDGSVLKQVQQLTASIKDIPVAKLRGEVV